MSRDEYGDDYGWDYYSMDFGAEYSERTVANCIYKYFLPILLVCGTVGNLVSLFIMLKLSRTVLSSCRYLALLAVVDLLVLYTRCGNDWFSHITAIDLSNMLMVSSESICKVYPFVFNFIFHMSKWLLVCLAIEGSLATRFPARAHKLCTLKRANAIILLLTVLLVCINIHYFWSFELIHFSDLIHPHGLFCTFVKHGHQYSEEFQELIWPILDLLVSEILPYAIVICSCISMLTHLCCKKPRDTRYDRYHLFPEALEQLKRTIFVICIIYLLLTLPKFAFIIFRYLVEKHELISYSFKLEAQQTLAQAICDSLEYCFLSCKFFFYLTTSRYFRKQLKKLLLTCLCKRRKNRECLRGKEESQKQKSVWINSGYKDNIAQSNITMV